MRFYSLTVLSFICINLFSQNEKLRGSVYDPIRELGVEIANIIIMNHDSVVVQETYSHPREEYNENGLLTVLRKEPADFEFTGLPEGEYLLKIVRDGYEKLIQPIHVQYSGRDKICDLGEFWLETKATQLSAAVVQGSRLLVVNKNDTLIYNVASLLIADEDMLDDLVKKLPDTEILDGKIYVRGKYVENLLIGGKDFFNGDISLALHNLPAYSVSKIKVYDKAGEATELTGIDKGDQEYVMDVILKKNYHGQWQGFIEAQGGTHKRYNLLGRLLRFDDRQAVVFVGETNNTGTSVMMQDPTWYGRSQNRDGNVFIQSLYSSYKFEPNQNFSFGARGTLRRFHERQYEYSASEIYLEQSNIFGRKDLRSNSERTEVMFHSNMRIRPYKSLSLNLKYDLLYNRNRMHAFVRQISALNNPDSLFYGVVLDSIFFYSSSNQLLQQWIQSKARQESAEANYFINNLLNFSAKQAIGKNILNWDFEFRNKHTDENLFNFFELSYPHNQGTVPDDYRHRYYKNRSNNISFNNSLNYSFNYIDSETLFGEITPYYTFSSSRVYFGNSLYRLDWAEMAPVALTWLPSEISVFLETLDISNTIYSWNYKANHDIGFKFSQDFLLWGKHWMRFSGNSMLNLVNAHENYQRNNRMLKSKRNAFFFNPSASLRFSLNPNDRQANKRFVQLSFALNHTIPNLSYLIEVVDDRDPLNIVSGNPNLKNSTRYNWDFWAHLPHARLIILDLKMSYNRVSDAIAFQQTYFKETGIIHRTPVNIDGNWVFSMDNSVGVALRKDYKAFITTSLSWRYLHSKDINSWEKNVNPIAQANTVQTSSPGFRLGVTYKPLQKFNIKMGFSGQWNHVNGSSDNFVTINTLQIGYTLETEAQLPWKINLKSSLSVDKRYGYSDRSLNKTIWLWNATLSKSVGKSLSFTINAYDILNQYRNIFTTLDAQGRTETYKMSQPAHFLFGLVWRFQKK